MDAQVTRLILKALEPAAIEASLAAAADLESERAAVDRHWRQRLERARYQVDQARRRYASVEPENRLVARTLERDWEKALTEQARLEAEHERVGRARRAAPSAAELAAIRDLSQDLSAMLQAASVRWSRAELEAITDGLTGLYNHRYLQVRLEEEIERARLEEEPLSLLFIDLDEFKAYNDSRGHKAGDEELRRVARAVEKHARRVDLVARYGGEEFVFFSPIFNIADSSITTGVFMLILFQKKLFKPREKVNPTTPELKKEQPHQLSVLLLIYYIWMSLQKFQIILLDHIIQQLSQQFLQLKIQRL